MKRVVGIVLAFSVAVYINLVCGHYPMAVIELFGYLGQQEGSWDNTP